MANTAWYNAAAPDYSANNDLLYSYTMTADLSQAPYSFVVQKLPATTIPLVDYFGKGVITTTNPATRVGFPTAYNVNDQYAVVTTGSTTRKVPNRIPINASGSTAPYIQAGTVSIVTLTQQGAGTPITTTVATDMASMVSASGVIVLFGIAATDAQITTLQTALSAARKPMVPSSNYVLPASLGGITVTPVTALVTQAVAVADVVRMFAQVPLPATTSSNVGTQIASVFGPITNNGIVDALFDAVPAPYLFAVTANAATIVRSRPTNNNYTSMIQTATSNRHLQVLITAAATASYTYMYNFNSGYNRNQVLGANGQVAPTGYRSVTDNNTIRNLSQALYPVVANNGIALKFSVSSTDYYLNGKGELWGSGPSYWVTAEPQQPPQTWSIRANGPNSGVFFYLPNSTGDLYMNGMGDQWGSGPTWWVSTDLNNGSRTPVDFNWTCSD